jgi:hypothetical protein
MFGILRHCGATRAPSPPQPRFGTQPAGQDPGEALAQDADTTAPFAAECQSFLRSSLLIARAGSGNYRPLGLQHAAHNGLVAGSSPASPTTHSHANRDFPWFDEYLLALATAVVRGMPGLSRCS